MTAAQGGKPETRKHGETGGTEEEKEETKLKKEKKNFFKIVFVLLALAIVAGTAVFYQFFYKKPASLKKTDISEKQPTQPIFTTSSLKNALPQFAEFKEEAVDIIPSIPQYTVEPGQLVNLKAVEDSMDKSLSSQQLQALANTGFFIIPGENKLPNGEETIDFMHGDFGSLIDEFLMHYKDIAGKSTDAYRKPENAVFITSDLLLHVFHVFLDRTFQHVEETQFHPKLLALTDLLFKKSLQEYQAASDPKIKASFERLTTFFLVPKVILEASKAKEDRYFMNPEEEQQALGGDEEIDMPENILAKLELYKNKLPAKVFQKAEEEIKLINKAEGMAVSPLLGQFKPGEMDDYSQYKPRSHYAKNSLLRSFWKAMIWFGRNGFLTKSDELTLDAIAQTIMLKNDQERLSLWENIYLPTVFFVGKSDDLTIYDYANLINQIYGDNIGWNDLTDGGKFNQFKEEVKKLAGPMIQSSIVIVEPDKTTKEEAIEVTKSFRFMGQRFIPDSFIFSSLTQGDEAPDKETGQKLPPIPTALMPMDIFGSLRAEKHLTIWIAQNAVDSDKVIAKESKKLKDDFDKLEIKDWTQNVYWSWLYTLKSLFQTFGQGYPVFMQNEAWNDKDLNSALGSWTELRHDTLLYAKQSYAELGAGGELPEPPPVPKGYVEPNLQFLNRVIALSEMTKEGLEKNNVLPEEQKWKMEKITEVFSFYRDIAKKQLQNEAISDDEFENLRISVASLNMCLTPPTGSFIKASEARAGLIADVHTAVTTDVQEILYEATGIPNIIFVAVKDTNGARLTRGVTYSYYEFTQPFGKRLSDQDWQANIYEGKTDFETPQAPEWTKKLYK